MVDLWWDEQDKQELLYSGVLQEPIASINRSNKGKWWFLFTELPGIGTGWVRYMPKDELKTKTEQAVRDWFGLANTDRPATDKDYE